jgi:3-oxoadipate enol-lactonase
MKTITLDGGLLEIEEHGMGPPLVMLHSLLTDSSAFDAVVSDLSRHRRVIRVNLPGFGKSSPAGSTIASMADRVAALFAALELNRDTSLLGNGFGGFVAAMLAIRHGKIFDRLILADAGAGFSEEGKAAFYNMAQLVRERGMGAVVDVAMKRLFPQTYIDTNPRIVEQRREVLLRNDPQRFAQACLALAALDMREAIRAVKNPTLVLVGALDSATPPAMSLELAELISTAQYAEIAGCGHAPMIQAPIAFVSTVKRFLDG